MTTRNATASRKLPAHRVASEDVPPYRIEPMGPTSSASRDIWRYLESMRPLRLAAPHPEIARQIQHGRSLIERLALCATDRGPQAFELSTTDCADVLTYFAWSEPVDAANWWKDDADESHVVGYCKVLDAMAASLRARGRRS